MRRKVPIALSISGSDPSGGAGLEADLKTWHQHGIYGMAIPTLLTVQNPAGVRAVRFLDPDFFREQWKFLFAAHRPDVIKIGALGSAVMVRRVGDLLRSREARGIPVVLDPVLGSTSGTSLLDAGALPGLKKLFRFCRLITPNAPELALLSGREIFPKHAAECLRDYARGQPFAVLLKGGHLAGEESVDFLFDRGRLLRLRAPRLRAVYSHGTGCVLASSIAVHLAWKRTLPQACRRAKVFVHNALAGAMTFEGGSGALDLWTESRRLKP